MNILDPHGPAASNLAALTVWVLVVFSVVAVVMWVLIVWPALRRRGTLAEHAPAGSGGGQAWILVGGLIVPFAILAAVFVASLNSIRGFPLHGDHAMGPAEIRVLGHQWWWEVRYLGEPPQQFPTANEIHLPAGRPVDVDLVSGDVIHSLWIPGLHGKVDLIPGRTNRIRLQADRPGIYQGQCAEFCGEQHAHMRLVVVADTPADYVVWKAAQRGPAITPHTPELLVGQQVFLSRPCALCHAVRGTPAQGGVAPDLTHLASRRGLAANILPNDRAALSAWVTGAQSIKPGARMPNVAQMDGAEQRALVHYLESLH
ncbi:MAG TPA: cytochrome c oxidase subunit II [Candidatus Polarisedimenticolaceae bacterium]|nr:cytochrome c oxidase subunit II [Candidatus Polarisedimenticolaceae bacterium]